jgi:hypothetical protein
VIGGRRVNHCRRLASAIKREAAEAALAISESFSLRADAVIE